MTIKLYPSRIPTYLFYSAYTIFVFFTLLNTSFYARYFENSLFLLILLFVASLLLMKEILEVRSINRDLLGLVGVGVSFVLTFMVSPGVGAKIVPLMLLFVFSARNIDFETLTRYSFKLILTTFLFIVLSSRLGIINNYISIRGGVAREYLGFRYVLFGAACMSNLTLLYLYIRKEKIAWLELIGLFVANYYYYIKSDARLTFLLSVVTLIVVAFMKLRGNRQEHEDYKLLSYLTMWIYPLSFVLSYYFVVRFNWFSDWQANLNSFLGNRLQLAQVSLQTYGFGLFGKVISWIGYGLDSKGELVNETYNYVDNFYIQVLQRYGLIFMIMFLAVMVMVMYKAMKQKRYYLILALSVIAVHGLIDDLILYLHNNTFILCIMYVLYSRSEEATLSTQPKLTNH